MKLLITDRTILQYSCSHQWGYGYKSNYRIWRLRLQWKSWVKWRYPDTSITDTQPWRLSSSWGSTYIVCQVTVIINQSQTSSIL